MTRMDATGLALAAGAAFVAGAVNAIAGGGSLITFPALLAAGLPPVAANVTNTIALCPGYFGATLAQRKDLAGQGARLRWIVPLSIAGGAAGGVLLLHTGEALFDVAVPFLILVACALLGGQDWIKRKLAARSASRHHAVARVIAVGFAAIYGGYFGAGMGVMALAVLALTTDDTLTRLNAVKQTIALSANVAAAIVFVAVAPIDWTATAVMAGAALAGGGAGGLVASRVPPIVLRVAVVALVVVVAVVYGIKLLR
jgi:hypothetical protein